MSKGNKVSIAVIRRLPKYYRYLDELLDKDVNRISSHELSVITGFTASQIRQDFNNFGGFGQQGYGYNVDELHKQLGIILGLEKSYNAILVGAGNLGQAVSNYKGFEDSGFKVLAMFDKNPKVIGLKIRGIEVLDIDDVEQFIAEHNVEIGIITTPKDQAQDIVDRFVNNGVHGIWNFAPTDLKVPNDVVVENVHLSESLFILSYLLKEGNIQK